VFLSGAPTDISLRRAIDHWVSLRLRFGNAVRSLQEKGRREYNEEIIFNTIIAQRAIEDESRRKSTRARRSKGRRPVTAADKPTEAKLHDIDMNTPPGEKCSVETTWDES
jgi:hypothetical protein